MSRALGAVKDQYDLIFIDCPPTLGILTINALTAADTVLISVVSNYLSLRGFQLLLRTSDLVQKRLNTQLTIAGIVATMFDRRTSHHTDVLQQLRQYFDGKIKGYDSIVPRSVRFEESPTDKMPMVRQPKDSPGAQAYRDLVAEVWDSVK